MTVKVLTKQNLEFLSLKGGCIGSSESTLVKMPHCWKSHVTAHLFFNLNDQQGLRCKLLLFDNKTYILLYSLMFAYLVGLNIQVLGWAFGDLHTFFEREL